MNLASQEAYAVGEHGVSGLIVHMLGTLNSHGKIGVTAFGRSSVEALALVDRFRRELQSKVPT